MTNDLPNLPAMATEKITPSPPPVCPVRAYADLGIYAKHGQLREAQASTDSSSGSADSVVCEDGEATGEQAQ
ncbi:MAG: hypothetical protein ACK5A0_11110 [Polaromonas sp.]|jgi:hypothetical protein